MGGNKTKIGIKRWGILLIHALHFGIENGKKRTNREKATSVRSGGKTKGKSVIAVCFRRLQKPETERDFNDKWILIKRVPEEIVRALRLRAICINDELN